VMSTGVEGADETAEPMSVTEKGFYGIINVWCI
jgi:hypothetical protein